MLWHNQQSVTSHHLSHIRTPNNQISNGLSAISDQLIIDHSTVTRDRPPPPPCFVCVFFVRQLSKQGPRSLIDLPPRNPGVALLPRRCRLLYVLFRLEKTALFAVEAMFTGWGISPFPEGHALVTEIAESERINYGIC